MGAGSPNRICEVDGCDKLVRARDKCSTHYNRDVYGQARHRRPATCETCGRGYAAQRKGQRFCSLLCRSGGAFAMREEDREAARQEWRDRRRVQRAQRRQIEVEEFTELEIYERDAWRCGICKRPVNRRRQWPDPLSPSLDHVIPLTEPGTSHTRANVRLAHLICNTSRGNRGGGEQLALVG